MSAMEGWVLKKSHNRWAGMQKRHLRLLAQDCTLAYFADDRPNSKAKGTIALRAVKECAASGKEITVEGYDDKHGEERKWVFHADTASDAADWEDAINGAKSALTQSSELVRKASCSQETVVIEHTDTAPRAPPGPEPEPAASPASPTTPADEESVPALEDPPRRKSLVGGIAGAVGGAVGAVARRLSGAKPPEETPPPAPEPEAESAPPTDAPAQADAEITEPVRKRTDAERAQAIAMMELDKSELLAKAQEKVNERAKAVTPADGEVQNTEKRTSQIETASINRSAAAERFAKGIAQKEAAVQMTVHSAMTRFKANAAAKAAGKEGKKADAQKLKPLIALLTGPNSESKVAVIGTLANLCMGRPENQLFCAANGVIPILLNILKETGDPGLLPARYPACVAISNLAADADVRDLLVGIGVVEAIAPLLALDDNQTLAAAVIALANLASDLGREVVLQTKALVGLVGLLKEERNVPDEIRANVCAALANMSFKARCKEAIVESGAIEMLTSVLTKGVEQGRGNAALALGNVSAGNPAYAELVMEAGALPKLIDLLGCNKVAVAQNAAGAAANIACSKKCAAVFVEAGMLTKLVDLIKNGTGAARAMAAAAMVNMAAGNEQKIVDLGVVPLLVDLAKNGTKEGKVSGIKVLANLSVSEEIREAVVSADVIPTIVVALKSENENLRTASALVVARLSLHKRARSLFDQHGITETLTSMLNGTPAEQTAAASALRNLVA